MNDGDEQLLRGRVHGHGHDDLDSGPEPGRNHAELVGGPLDIHRWRTVEVDDGVALVTELGPWLGRVLKIGSVPRPASR